LGSVSDISGNKMPGIDDRTLPNPTSCPANTPCKKTVTEAGEGDKVTGGARDVNNGCLWVTGDKSKNQVILILGEIHRVTTITF